MSLYIPNKIALSLFLIMGLLACNSEETTKSRSKQSSEAVALIVLGNVQDAGSPHIGCNKACCRELFVKPDPLRKVVSLGIVDPLSDKTYLLEATPDIAEQLKILKSYSRSKKKELPDAVFLTHAHIGHYTGLMYFGKEAIGAKEQVVFAMPKMQAFLEGNGPWDQLVNNKNILIKGLSSQVPQILTKQLKMIAFTVPHRDEYSETVGYKIIGPSRSALFIPDIDKWSKWEKNITEEISKVDYAFLDATFYDGKEINHRDISEIPHPFVIESMDLFDALAPSEKAKINFIHLNHTNPALDKKSAASVEIVKRGFKVARMHDVFLL